MFYVDLIWLRFAQNFFSCTRNQTSAITGEWLLWSKTAVRVEHSTLNAVQSYIIFAPLCLHKFVKVY